MKHLDVTLDKTLSFKEDLIKTAENLKTSNNVLEKLCGTKCSPLLDPQREEKTK